MRNADKPANPFEGVTAHDNTGDYQEEEKPSPRALLDALQAAHAAHNLLDATLLLDLLESIVGEPE